ncbi:uncharacterized protein CTRU02_203193 [Colletotrichum truncatum]|uniref:Uncharacterized protein n=1 Tax=Colletotrichum truncatum TaxID=5467 RepID=A0ACC3Z8R5_COLTU|nr:uncharacterized protein CTRU02_09033 [Colletotrichum truncatum]KAF6789241.1 hypothetical protein CTRU02_09033 [Colletotrichum truncatum]
MKSLSSGSLCALGVGLSLLVRSSSAAEFRRHDGIHRLEKAHVTAFADLERRAPVCSPGYTGCPSSLNGGCCESGFACATDSCYATTRAPRTCGGHVGYYACEPVIGNGCCPEGYRCERGSNCVAVSGVVYSQSCPASYYLCPASLSYGCCRNGLGCAVSACYSTDPSTYIQTTTITTTDEATRVLTTTVTATTVITPSRPSTAPPANPTVEADRPDQVVFKYYPSIIPKEQPISDDDDSSDGLTTAQIAGIVAGGVGLLIIVLVAAWIIIRHLNKVVQAVETSNRGTSTGTKSRPSVYQFKPTPSEVDDMSVDPLMMSPRPSHRRRDSETTTNTNNFASPDFTPPYRGTPGTVGDYQPVPQGSGSDRHMSYDSAYNGGYFDVVSDRSHRNSQGSSAWIGVHRQSTDSQGTYAHLRHWSNASEASSEGMQELDSTPYVPELAATPVPDAAAEARRRSGSGLSGMSRPAAVHQRRRSSDGGNGRGRSDSSAAAGGLSVVSEDTEVSANFGASNYGLGQTRTGR